MNFEPSQIMLFADIGYRSAKDGMWRLRISGTAYQPGEVSIRNRMLLKVFGRVMKASPQDLECELFSGAD